MKAAISSLLLLLTSLACFGQENHIEAGVELGPNAARYWGTDMDDPNLRTRIGFAGGMFFQMNMSRYFSLHNHLSYEQKGFAYTMPVKDGNGNTLGNYSVRANFHYVTFGALARLSAGNKVKGFLNIGPYVAALVEESEYTSGMLFPAQKTKNTDRFSPFDIGISTGIGLSVPFQTQFAISFEVRNNFGLYNVSEVVAANNGTFQHVSNHFLLGLSYRMK